MKPELGRKSMQHIEFEAEYAAALREYAMGGGETVLRRAYELGRRAIAERKSLLELVSIHHQILRELFQSPSDQRSQTHLVNASCDFLSECVSPYEMAQRGFQDALKALRQLNETLEEEIKRIAYSVHDEPGSCWSLSTLLWRTWRRSCHKLNARKSHKSKTCSTKSKNTCAAILTNFARRFWTTWAGFPPFVFSLREFQSA